MKCNHCSSFNRKRAALLCAGLFACGVLMLPGRVGAVVTLTDINSVARIDPNTQAGMYSWQVDGGEQLAQQWFWYRIGTGTTAASIDSISAPVVTPTGTSAVEVKYENSDFSLSVFYGMTGGSLGSGTSDMLETIMVQNKLGSTLDFHLFQYSDFDLAGTAGGDEVEIFFNGSGYDFVTQKKGLTEIQEAITSPQADRAEAAITPSTLNNLNTTVDYDLSNMLTAGPGDATWALQWNASIAAGSSFDVFKDKLLHVTPIPEPSGMALILLGLGVCGLARRRA